MLLSGQFGIVDWSWYDSMKLLHFSRELAASQAFGALKIYARKLCRQQQLELSDSCNFPRWELHGMDPDWHVKQHFEDGEVDGTATRTISKIKRSSPKIRSGCRDKSIFERQSQARRTRRQKLLWFLAQASTWWVSQAEGGRRLDRKIEPG